MSDSTSNIPLRCCNRKDQCIHPQGPFLPDTSEYFGVLRNGLSSRCKLCAAEYARRKYHENLEKRRAQNRAAYHRHRERNNETSKAWKKRNADKVREYRREWQKANRAKANQYIYSWRKTHPGKANETTVLWRKRHPEQVRVIKRKYDSRIKHLKRDFTAKDWLRALEYFKGCCAVCGRPQGLWHKLAMDHWIPVARDGTYTSDNIVPLCHGIGGCNNSKGDKNAYEWLVEQFGTRKANQIQKRIQAYFNYIKETI